MMKHRLKRAISLLCAFAICVGLLPAGALAVNESANLSGGINGYQATMQADVITSNGWRDAFVVEQGSQGAVSIEGTQRSSALNGKIWADKSVALAEDDETFDVTFSTLGQTFASKNTTQMNAALDVVFVVDVSPSMGFAMDSSSNEYQSNAQDTRMYAATLALNSAVNILMENDNNRIGVVTFGGSAEQMVPLNHYDKSNGQTFFSYENHYVWGSGSFGGVSGNLRFTSTQGWYSQEYISSTNPQDGLFEAADMLESATLPEESPTRLPVVILLTDGDPNEPDDASHYIKGTYSDGSTSISNHDTTQADRRRFFTICTAAYHKDQIQNHYKNVLQNGDEAVTTKFYTIGLGLNEDSDNEIMLNPKTRSSMPYSTVTRLMNDYSAEQMKFSSYDYADSAYVGEMTSQELEDIFNTIIGEITSITGGADVGESTGGRNNITYYETLGDGVQFTGEMTLTVPTYTVSNNVMTPGQNRTYTLTAYKEDNTVLDPDEGPAYIEGGGVVTFKATQVQVGNGQFGNLDLSNNYDKAADESLKITVRQISSGQRQMQVDIPPALMAYNVINTTTVDDHSTSTYYQSNGPLQLTYGVQMREDKTAGDWLVSAPAQSYVSFFPSSAQTTEDIYDMPYYWRGGQFEQDDPQAEKTGGSVQGSSGYIYAAEKNQNNEVRIYLGNNGLYRLTGKDLTFHLFWDDANNQDGMRPESVTVELYREKVSDNNTNPPTTVPNDPELRGTATLNSSNVTTSDTNMWELRYEDRQVYQDNQYLRYWLKITSNTDGYTAAINDSSGHNYGTPIKDTDQVWYCFNTDSGLLTDAMLDVKLSHTPETVDYTVEKIWQGDIGRSATMQLVANGQPATEEVVGDRGDLAKPLTATNEVEAGSHTWMYTWENLPKYSNGEEITYRAAETAVGANEGVYYQTSYDFTQTGKTTVTNTSQDAEQAKMNFTARVSWDDADNVDNVRPNSVTLKLVAKANGQNVPAEDLTDILLEQTVSGPNWTVVWENLPRFTSAHEQITYSIVELDDSNEEIGLNGRLNDDYTVSDYSSFGDGYMTVTNTHTPATVAITITKEWSDSNNQDGIRPSSVSGVLYKKVGVSGEITAVSTFSIPNTSGSITLSNLPKNESGQPITYYVSEHAVNGYTLSVQGQEADDQDRYEVQNNAITLINTHAPATIDYKVTLVWNDHNNEDKSRPISVTVTVDGKEITLPVQNDQIQAPTGEQYEFVSDGEGGGTLTVTLSMYENGKLKDYSSSVTAPDKYTSSITGVGSNSITYTLSYTSQPVTLGFTKVWSGDDAVKDDMRPNENAYARYLTLKQNNTTYSATPTVTDNNNNGTYTVTYNNLPKRDDNGVAYAYTVTESKVPNYTASSNTVTLTADNSNLLTNTYEQETYAPITVTKQWVGDADGQRPETEDNAISINLYKSKDTSYMTAIGAPSVTDNDDGTWTYTWNNVPRTNADGSAISYVAYESEVPDGYTATVRQVDVINGTASGSIINTLNSGAATTGTLTITKSWQDDQYTDKRPASLSFNVYGDYGETNDTHEITRNVTMTPSGGNWTTNVADLPVTVNGQPVTYTVEELNVPVGYKATVDYGTGNENGVTLNASIPTGVTVTNTYTPDTWTLTYHANGGTGAPTDDEVYSKTNATATVKGQGKMTYDGYTFLGWTTEIHGVVVDADDVPAALYKADNTLPMTGDATLYAVWAVDSNGDNKPDYEQKQITVNVVWMDDGNRCGIRPNEIAFKLNGTEYPVDLTNEKGVLVTTNEGNTQWIYTVPTLLDEDASFTIDDISDIVVTPEDHADSTDKTGYTSSVAYADDVFTITLTHTPETTSHSVEKNWDFGDATFTTGTATIQLFANGQPALDSNNQPLTQTFVPEGSEPLGWNDLPKYEGGQLITYQAIETQVVDTSGNDVTAHFRAEYDTSTPGMTQITNTYTELRNITLHYFWDDNNNAAGERPSNITVQLFYTISDDTTTRAAGVQPVENSEKTISADSEGNWNVTWTDLPIYDVDGSGKVLNYEAHVVAYTDAEGTEHNNLNLGENNDELTGSNYTFDVVSFGMDSVFIMNSAMDTTTDFKVTKQWNDANNAYTTRPDTIWVNLMQDGVVYQSAEVTKDNWTHTWADLPVYPTGSNDAYDYTVSEIPVPGYTATVNGNTITNTLDALSNPDDPDNQLTVTFVYNNGDPNTTQTVPFGGTAKSITPTWDGHAFKGWYTDNGTFVNPYDFTDPVTDNITLYAKWVSIHDGKEDPDDHHFVTFVYENASATNNGTAIAENTKIKVACGNDYTFTAAADSGYILNTPTKVGSATLVANGNNSFTLDNITSDITVTITATRQTTGGGTGGGGGGGSTRPELEKGDHFAYIVGYEDGTVRPENNITRAEVATIFFRLLTEESREAYYSEVNAFTDVSDGDWYNNAISTLVNADIITGYTDGSFRPDAYITRAELAAIASRFDDISGGETRLTDIDGHWAEELISSAYNKGWVDGYPDGSFRPDQNITRAEVMTLVNRVLERAVDQDGMLDDMVTWSDNQPSSWYYEAVQEATNSHDYSRDEGETLETWTEITPPRDWTELEK